MNKKHYDFMELTNPIGMGFLRSHSSQTTEEPKNKRFFFQVMCRFLALILAGLMVFLLYFGAIGGDKLMDSMGRYVHHQKSRTMVDVVLHGPMLHLFSY